MNGLMIAIGLALFLLTLPGTVELLLVTIPGLFTKRSKILKSFELAPKLAVVTPAHNEEAGIGQTIESLLACDDPLSAQSLFVVADNCTDHTAEIATELGCSVIERNDLVNRGKGYALNHAFELLKDKGFDAFIIVDADTRVEANFLNAFRSAFANGVDAAQAGYRVGNPEAGLRPRLMHIAFLGFNFLRPLSRQRLNFSAGIFGNGFALSSKTLAAVPYDSFSIVEDLEYHLRLLRSGRSVQFLLQTNVWSDMPVTSEEAQSQRERWEGGRFRIQQEQIPTLFHDVFIQRKSRLIEPLLDLLLLPLSYHVLLLGILLVIGVGWLKFYALAGLLAVALHVVVAMLLGGASKADWITLLKSPFYILWKVVKLSSILKAAGKDAEWKRTSRGG